MMKKENEALQKKEYYSSLLLTYCSLLTKNIYRRMESYYLMDYSITEIAENEKVSRNAVFESLEQGIKKLDELESKLKLYQKNNEISSLLEKTIEAKSIEEKNEILMKWKGEIDNGI